MVQDLSRYVAIAEEYPNDTSDKIKSGGLMHDRRIARIITPGTLIDENFMDPYANNYVMAIHIPDLDALQEIPDTRDAHNVVAAPPPGFASAPVGMAWLDLSTGHFFTQLTTLSSLGSVLSRVSPREIVLQEDLQSQPAHSIFPLLTDEKHLITYARMGTLMSVSDWTPLLESDVPKQAVEDFSTDEVQAGNLLLSYVKDRLQGLSMRLQPPLRYEAIQVMNIDKNSLRALEIKQTIRDGAFRGSLLHAIRRTATKSGARLLNEWLSALYPPQYENGHINFG